MKTGGTIVLVGLALSDAIGFNFIKLITKEAQIKTVFRYRNLYPIAVNALANGNINLTGIVTHCYDFKDIKEAFDYTIDHKNDVVKSVIKID